MSTTELALQEWLKTNISNDTVTGQSNEFIIDVIMLEAYENVCDIESLSKKAIYSIIFNYVSTLLS